MVQKHIVQLEDDIDGGAAAETVTFALEGVSYEIDLSAKNADKLRDALSTYVGHGRRVGRSGGRGGASRRAGRGAARTDREQTHAMREWARKNGYKVGDKGRIPAHIAEAYQAKVAR
jgi:hypothetical protein